MKQKTDAIILARGGSKGIHRKNIKSFCGKPLLVWTIECCLSVPSVRHTYVSSDDFDILTLAAQHGCRTIARPRKLSGDEASSESGWLHAIEEISKGDVMPNAIIAPQATSPLRLSNHLEDGLNEFHIKGLDSLFSAVDAKDLCLWNKEKNGTLSPANYDPSSRGIRQHRPTQIIENGSFYIFKPEVLLTSGSRFGKLIDYYLMPAWTLFEIDEMDDWELCEVIMQHYAAPKYGNQTSRG